MDDASGGGGARVVLITVQQGAWLLEGEEFIDAVLAKSGYYPTPVRLLTFVSNYDMSVYLSSQTEARLADLWSIRSEVIDRLRADGELDELTPPAL
ncbi:MAG: hypothetical protein AAGI50_13955 [Pseudomonadota bacterium]